MNIDLQKFMEDRAKALRWLMPCPKCGLFLYDGHGGGVQCRGKGCGYWFCF